MAREWGKSLSTYCSKEYDRDLYGNEWIPSSMPLKNIRKVKKTPDKGIMKELFKLAFFAAIITLFIYLKNLI